jgi:ABC-2 type transport system ATP-binding protein
MIEAKNLVRRYGDFAAVDDVSFSIEPGEVVGLLGHNGAGKTTIMKMVTGFLEPSSGVILVDGVSVQDEPRVAQAAMGYLPESLPLYPELTVVDYLSYAAQLRGLDPQSAVRDAVEATQLQAKALDTISTLSRGYKQRVGVAQAILHKPKFLILDEPSNGLDPSQIQQLRELIRRLAQSATVILSTHIMQEVDAVCDRVIILRAGRVAVDERLSDLQETMELSLKSLPDADVVGVLSSHKAVANCSAVGVGHWQVGLHGDVQSSAAEVASALVAAGLPIYEITPHSRDLESVFKEINEGQLAGEQDAA